MSYFLGYLVGEIIAGFLTVFIVYAIFKFAIMKLFKIEKETMSFTISLCSTAAVLITIIFSILNNMFYYHYFVGAAIIIIYKLMKQKKVEKVEA